MEDQSLISKTCIRSNGSVECTPITIRGSSIYNNFNALINAFRYMTIDEESNIELFFYTGDNEPPDEKSQQLHSFQQAQIIDGIVDTLEEQLTRVFRTSYNKIPDYFAAAIWTAEIEKILCQDIIDNRSVRDYLTSFNTLVKGVIKTYDTMLDSEKQGSEHQCAEQQDLEKQYKAFLRKFLDYIKQDDSLKEIENKVEQLYTNNLKCIPIITLEELNSIESFINNVNVVVRNGIRLGVAYTIDQTCDTISSTPFFCAYVPDEYNIGFSLGHTRPDHIEPLIFVPFIPNLKQKQSVSENIEHMYTGLISLIDQNKRDILGSTKSSTQQMALLNSEAQTGLKAMLNENSGRNTQNDSFHNTTDTKPVTDSNSLPKETKPVVDTRTMVFYIASLVVTVIVSVLITKYIKRKGKTGEETGLSEPESYKYTQKLRDSIDKYRTPHSHRQ